MSRRLILRIQEQQSLMAKLFITLFLNTGLAPSVVRRCRNPLAPSCARVLGPGVIVGLINSDLVPESLSVYVPLAACLFPVQWFRSYQLSAGWKGGWRVSLDLHVWLDCRYCHWRQKKQLYACSYPEGPDWSEPS